MGCVQSLFKPPKPRSPSPEREFVPPKFDMVTVTQQPRKSRVTAEDTDSTGRSARDNDDDDDDDDDDVVVTKCDDFDKYALEENADGRSLHFVEATAVRTLAANSGSVAILGTTAKCKSLGSSPAVRQPLTDRQKTWSPSFTPPPPPMVGSKSQPELQTPYGRRADATTASSTPTADTESFEIPVETVYSKLEPETLTDTDGSIRLVKATAVRCLAAETGSIAILASTAVLQQQPPVQSSEDVQNLMPVGVREVLDSEPDGQQQQQQQQQLDRGDWTGEQRPMSPPHDADPQIPLPVIYAMEMKSRNGQIPENTFRPIESVMPGCSSPVETSTRKPFLRQSNETGGGKHQSLSSDGWTPPTVPVFAKCLPVKSKSLPSKDIISVDEQMVGDGNGNKPHGVVRGSSLPFDRNSCSEAAEDLFLDSTKYGNKDDKTLVCKSNVILRNEIQSDNAIERKIEGSQVERENSQDDNGNGEIVDDNEKEIVVKSTDDDDDRFVVENERVRDDRMKRAVENSVEVNVQKSADGDSQNSVDVDVQKSVDGDVQNVVDVNVQKSTIVDVQKSAGIDVQKSADSDDPGVKVENDKKTTDQINDEEYRLTMIQSVREAVNKICEQAVEKTAAIVKSGHGYYPKTMTSSGVHDGRDAADDFEAADYTSSEFSLPPPPPPSDPASMGQESSWPPPPPLSEAEEERTIAPGFSFDLPDPPTEMDQMDSETDKLDISDEEMRATGLPSDDDEKMDIEDDEGDMKSTATAEEGMTTTIAAVDDGADDRAATTIQAVYRGFRARKYVETVTAAAVKIQAGFRGYRVRQSLKNAAPPSSTATTTTTADNSQCWSDDDQKSVVSVTYAPLNEEPAAVATATVAVIDDDEVFAYDGDKAECTNDDDGKECTDGGRPPEQQTTAGAAVAAADDEDDVRALTDAAVKIQARVRGFAVRKHLNEEKKKADKE